jgi:hypothetical protein
MEACVCGNVLDAQLEYRCTRSPCRCAVPGRGPGQLRCHDLPSWVLRKQYDERKRLGLPVVTPIERTLSHREV